MLRHIKTVHKAYKGKDDTESEISFGLNIANIDFASVDMRDLLIMPLEPLPIDQLPLDPLTQTTVLPITSKYKKILFVIFRQESFFFWIC